MNNNNNDNGSFDGEVETGELPHSEIRIWEQDDDPYYRGSSWSRGYTKIAGGLYPSKPIFSVDFPPTPPGQDRPFGLGFLKRLIAASPGNNKPNE